MAPSTALATLNATNDFRTYEKALAAARSELEAESRAISEDEFRGVLRPYFWFLHAPGFQDLYDAASSAMEVLAAEKDRLLGETLPLVGNDYLALATLLAHYLDEGNRNTTGFTMLYSSAEIASSLIARDFAEKLEQAGNPPGASALARISQFLSDVEGARHDAYYCLRVVADQHLGLLESFIHALDGDAQGFILHALDGFPGNPKVKAFYRSYIAKIRRNPDLSEEGRQSLIEQAEKYQARLLGREKEDRPGRKAQKPKKKPAQRTGTRSGVGRKKPARGKKRRSR